MTSVGPSPDFLILFDWKKKKNEKNEKNEMN